MQLYQGMPSVFLMQLMMDTRTIIVLQIAIWIRIISDYNMKVLHITCVMDPCHTLFHESSFKSPAVQYQLITNIVAPYDFHQGIAARYLARGM